MDGVIVRKENKAIIYSIYAFTAVVFGLVIILHELPSPGNAPSFIGIFPMLNAFINGTCFLVLITSLIAIKNKKVKLHQYLNTSAMLLSVLFLLSYVFYHLFADETKYGGDFLGIYYFILVTHIILAGVSLPFILLAYYRGFIGDIAKHRKMVKFVYPIWLYVAFTGVLVFLFLAPYYN